MPSNHFRALLEVMIEAEHNIHTNHEWYPFPELGSFFRLEGGTLLQLPMLADGGRGTDEEIAEVDWHNIEGSDRERLSEIQSELMNKE